ncbi:MAG: extracellular solute-binding protein [Chloroflexi bacterium]|nr:extracellular solute-binding protein [Chloroflexota bacterium]
MSFSYRRFAALALIFTFAISSCQPAQVDATATPSVRATSAPKVESTPTAASSLGVRKEALKGLVIQVWQPWFGIESNLFEAQVQEFNRTNEWGVTVQSISQINYSQLYNNTTTALPTANRPQLVIALPEHALAWNAGDYVVDLNTYISDPVYGFSNADIKDFPPIFLTQDSIGDKRLGLPAERSARFLLYNVSWARQLGFDSAPKTADDFREQACRARQSMFTDTVPDNDAQGGWLVDTNAMTALSWLTAFGGGVLEGNDYRFLTPKNIAALTFVKQLYDDGCAWASRPDADLPSIFSGRKALFMTAGLEELSDYSRGMAAASNADEWTVLSFPGDIQNGLMIYGSSFVMLKSTPEQQLAAWLFVRWMLSPENQARWVQTTGLFPLRTSSLEALTSYSNSHPQWAAAVALIPDGKLQPQLASWRKVRVMLGDGFNSMFRLNIPAGRVAEILAVMESTARDLSK